ncbi:archease [Thalassovita aquimarina]|uniref:Archease n=1 Tax=Thalassovita aquimarina TaxID=2785917 RepID=A0ABS5HNI7_9RHOB|nr:archease [Thalassovita aquimarina]MBR9650515.1 archease [Thalassovita aquimarina]
MADDAGSPGWSHFPHQGDVGVRGIGRSMAEAFENAARALTEVVAPLASIRSEQSVTVSCRATDPSILLLDWLNEVTYAMATRSMLFGEFHVRISGDVLKGEMRGEPVDRARHEPSVEPKGATLTELCVKQQPDGLWLAQCVVDV